MASRYAFASKRYALAVVGALAVIAATLASCASSPAVVTGTPSSSATSATAPEASPTPTPTCAVPEQPGVESPEGCVVYDGEANMELNELYRERMEMTDAARAVGEEYVGPLTSALTAWRDSGAVLTEDGARDVFAEAGFDVEVVQVRESHGEVLFGVGIDGGCVFGAVTPDAVAVDVGGYIMDGGCLAAVGH
ncbi:MULTISPECIES: hypothetical protein [Bacteria]